MFFVFIWSIKWYFLRVRGRWCGKGFKKNKDLENCKERKLIGNL